MNSCSILMIKSTVQALKYSVTVSEMSSDMLKNNNTHQRFFHLHLKEQQDINICNLKLKKEKHQKKTEM